MSRENICHIVKSPANDVSRRIRILATEVAHKAVSSLDGAGVFAVELFLTEDNQVYYNYINETYTKTSFIDANSVNISCF